VDEQHLSAQSASVPSLVESARAGSGGLREPSQVEVEPAAAGRQLIVDPDSPAKVMTKTAKDLRTIIPVVPRGLRRGRNLRPPG
jgi:hypothetical protein